MKNKNNKSTINTIKPDRPGGFLDYLTPEYLAREKILKIVEKVFRSFGFNPIETPRIEFLKILSGEKSDTGKNIFHIKGGDDKESLAMPFDHTIPFARILAANPYNAKDKTGMRLPWRRMVVGPVFRGEKPQGGRYRQFYQFDIDIAGSNLMLADAEIIAVIYKTFVELGIKRFLIRLNNRKILNGLADALGVSDRGKISSQDITNEIMRILDKLEKIGIEKVAVELQKKPINEFDCSPCLTKKNVEKIKSFLKIKGNNLTKLSECEKIFFGISAIKKGVAELREILKLLKSINIPEDIVSVDFSIARGLDYYTGPVIETVLLDAREFGSVFGGGRYNDLVKRFTGEELPATGASLGVDRLFSALDYLGLINRKKQSVVDVMVLRLQDNLNSKYLAIANDIRSVGLNVEICLLDDTTFKRQFNFAVSKGVKFILIYGEDELKKQIVSIKNLYTRKQVEIKENNMIDWFRKNKE